MLKNIWLVLASTFALVTVSLAGNPSEKELLAADSKQAEAARTRNASDLDAMMHPMFMVNSPEGEVWSKEKVIRMWRNRGIGHDSFERTVEQVKITNDIGVVMGHEVVAPSVDSVAGQRRRDGARPVERRFTNIWVWQDNKWWFLARHAHEQPGSPPAQKK